jgi:excinuclease ABC subunit C
LTTKFSIAGLPVYPHIKLTREEYPRLLATRVVKDDCDEYFGAFLSRTSVRILIDFLNRTFRLRSCDIEIDGNFPVPCTQYFAKRCLAPCMASLCTREFHAEIADLARLFLRNERQLFIKEASSRIESLAEALDFEKAAFLRDVLKNVGIFWSKPRWQIWLDDAVDTYDVEVVGNKVRVYLVTQRGRHVLGDRVFEFERNDDVTVEEAVFEVIRQFYTFHLPREIRVPKDFAGRKEIAERLGRRFGRNVKIVVGAFHDKRPTAQRGIERARQKVELESVAPRKTFAVISEQLKTDFELSTKPVRIEAFDIASHVVGLVLIGVDCPLVNPSVLGGEVTSTVGGADGVVTDDDPG